MKFYFDSGLPRSGSTLLTALLNQNPNIHAGTLSPVFELMYYTDEILHKEQALAFPKPKVFQEIVTNTLINHNFIFNIRIIINNIICYDLLKYFWFWKCFCLFLMKYLICIICLLYTSPSPRDRG